MRQIIGERPDRPRIFLSYGRRDAQRLAERLYADLTARGYAMWQDVERIRTGWHWDEVIEAGLRECRAMLFLQTPSAVRQIGPEAFDDSSCRDELMFARNHAIPVVPVKVMPCDAPLSIYRLHHVGFQRWNESDAAYQEGLDRICDGLDMALRGETLHHAWHRLIEPLDFEAFLREKRSGFTGRTWLFHEIDEWRSTGSGPVLLIVGEPGIGKSALVAELVGENPAGQVIAFHCCQADTPVTLEPSAFTRSVAAMLSARLEGYVPILDDVAIVDALERAENDPASAFEAAVVGPLQKLAPPEGGRRYLIIDGLDEAVTSGRQPTIIEMLSTRVRRLPSWFGIVCTTRRHPEVLHRLRDSHICMLNADDPRNYDDLRAFVQRRLDEPAYAEPLRAGGELASAVATKLLKATAGNFLFAATALNAIKAAQLPLDEIKTLPPGLSSLYEVFIDRLYGCDVEAFEPARRVLAVIAAARDALDRDEIAAVTGLHTERELAPILARLAPFLAVREAHYAFFHKSFSDWLTGWDARQDQPVAGRYHVRVQQGETLLTDWCRREVDTGSHKVPLYCHRHFVAHLCAASGDSDARALVTRFDWLHGKLKSTDVDSLLADYDRLRTDDSAAANSELARWDSFFRERAHVLRRGDSEWPAHKMLVQLASEEPSDGVVGEAARSWLRQGNCDWIWLRRAVVPTHSSASPCLIVLEAGEHPVEHAWAQPGQRILSWSVGGMLRAWDLQSGRVTSSVQTDWNSSSSGALLIDSGRLLTWSRSECLRVRDIETGDVLASLEVQPQRPSAAIILPNSNVVWRSDDEILRGWDWRRGEVSIFKGHGERVSGALLLSDGRLVSWSTDKTLRIWSLETGKTLTVLEGHGRAIDGAIELPLNRLASWDNESLHIWNLTSAVSIGRLNSTSFALQFRGATSLSHERLASWSDYAINVWDLRTNALAATLYDKEGFNSEAPLIESHIDDTRVVKGVMELPSNRLVSWSESEVHFRCWDLGSGKLLARHSEHQAEINGAALLPDGKILTWSDDATLRIWNGSMMSQQREAAREVRKHSPGRTPLTLDLGRERVLSWGSGLSLHVWNQASGSHVATFQHKSQVQEAWLLPKDRVLSWCEVSMNIWSISSGRCLKTLKTASGYRGVSLLDNNRLVSWSGMDYDLRLWNRNSGRLVRRLSGHTLRINGVAGLKHDMLASYSDDCTVRLWTGNGNPGHVLKHPFPVTSPPCLLSDERIITWSGNDLLVWDLQSGERVSRLRHDAPISTVITLSHHRFVSIDFDSALRVYQVEPSGLCALESMLANLKEYVFDAVALDESRLIIQHFDFWTIWDIQTGERTEVMSTRQALQSRAVWLEPYLQATPRFREKIQEDFLLSEHANGAGVWPRALGSSCVALWHDTGQSIARQLYPDGTVVVATSTGHVHILKLYRGDRPITLEELSTNRVNLPDAAAPVHIGHTHDRPSASPTLSKSWWKFWR